MDKALRRRSREETRSIGVSSTRPWRARREWIVLDTTQKALVPMVMLMVLCGFAGWSMGMRQSACPTLSLPSGQTDPLNLAPWLTNPQPPILSISCA